MSTLTTPRTVQQCRAEGWPLRASIWLHNVETAIFNQDATTVRYLLTADMLPQESETLGWEDLFSLARHQVSNYPGLATDAVYGALIAAPAMDVYPLWWELKNDLPSGLMDAVVAHLILRAEDVFESVSNFVMGTTFESLVEHHFDPLLTLAEGLSRSSTAFPLEVKGVMLAALRIPSVPEAKIRRLWAVSAPCAEDKQLFLFQKAIDAKMPQLAVDFLQRHWSRSSQSSLWSSVYSTTDRAVSGALLLTISPDFFDDGLKRCEASDFAVLDQAQLGLPLSDRGQECRTKIWSAGRPEWLPQLSHWYQSHARQENLEKLRPGPGSRSRPRA